MSTTAATGPSVGTPLDDLADDALLAAFEGGSVAPGSFHHRHHVRMAWVYLDRRPVLDVLARFAEGLRRLAAAAGKPGLYHETITWAYSVHSLSRTNSSKVVVPSVTRSRHFSRSVCMPASIASPSSSSASSSPSMASFSSGETAITSKIARRPR